MACSIIIDNIFTLFLFVIFGLYIRYYLSSYLSEKAKNWADKEDITDITEKIESVKSEFVSKSEILKTDLQLILNYQIEHRNEERKVLIEFHHFLNDWINKCFNFDVVSYNRGNTQDLFIKRKEIRELYDKCNLAKSKVDFIVKNHQLIEISGLLLIEGLKFSYFVESFILSLYYKYQNQNSITDDFLRIFKDIESNMVLGRSLANEEKAIKLEIEELISNFMNSKLETCKPIIPILNNFNVITKQYLTENL